MGLPLAFLDSSPAARWRSGTTLAGDGEQVRAAAVTVTLVSALLIGCLAVYVARHGRVAGGAPLAVVLTAGALGYSAYAMELASTGMARQTWGDLKYITVVVVTLAFLAFNLSYTGHSRWLNRRRLALLGLPAGLVLVLLAAPATHGWVRHYSHEQLHAAFGAAGLGPAGVVFACYSAALVAVSVAVTVVTLARISRLYHRQVAALAAAVALPWVFNLLFTFGIWPFARFDATAEAFLLAGAVLVWGVFRFRLADLAPLAIATVVSQMPEAVIVLDSYGRVVDLNPASEAMLSASRANAVGFPLNDLLGWPSEPSSLPPRAEISVTGELGARDYEVTVTPLAAHPGEPPAGHLVVLRDITERKAAQAHLERFAHHDPLTGLPNRVLFDDRFELALSASRRRLQPLVVLYLDLDGFKRVNDTFGHEAGDGVLRECALRLLGALRAEDTVSRTGGDEFVVLLAHGPGTEGALGAASKVLACLTAPFAVAGTTVALTASIGVAMWPDHGSDQRALLRAADEAMYQGKRRGGNQVVVASSTCPGQAEIVLRDQEIRRALGMHQLRAFFQPVVTFDGDPAFMEAELRWRHPHDGLLAPVEFETVANSAGLRRPLRRLLIAEACQNTDVWARELARPVAVSVRLERRDLTDGTLMDDVGAALTPSVALGHRFIVEFVDGQTQAERDALLPGLQALKDNDVELSLDDFGACPTSPERLLHLPLHQVKLSSRLVGEAASDPRARRVLADVIDLARDLELSVVGRGSEGTDRYRVLRDLGCDLVQLGPDESPLSSSAALAWLRSA